jgi:hypothetical protein
VFITYIRCSPGSGRACDFAGARGMRYEMPMALHISLPAVREAAT